MEVLNISNRTVANEIEKLKSESHKEKEETGDIIIKNNEEIAELQRKISQQQEVNILKLNNRTMANEIGNLKSEYQKDKAEKEEVITKNDEEIT